MKTLILTLIVLVSGEAFGAASSSSSRTVSAIGSGYAVKGHEGVYLPGVLQELAAEIQTEKDFIRIFQAVHQDYEQMSAGRERAKRIGRAATKIFTGLDTGKSIAAHVKVMAILHSVAKILRITMDARFMQAVETILEKRLFVTKHGVPLHFSTKERPYNIKTGLFNEPLPEQPDWYRSERPEYIKSVNEILKKLQPVAAQVARRVDPQAGTYQEYESSIKSNTSQTAVGENTSPGQGREFDTTKGAAHRQAMREKYGLQ